MHGATSWLDDKEEAEKPLSLAAFPLRGALALPRVLDHLGSEVHCRHGLDGLQERILDLLPGVLFLIGAHQLAHVVTHPAIAPFVRPAFPHYASTHYKEPRKFLTAPFDRDASQQASFPFQTLIC